MSVVLGTRKAHCTLTPSELFCISTSSPSEAVVPTAIYLKEVNANSRTPLNEMWFCPS